MASIPLSLFVAGLNHLPDGLQHTERVSLSQAGQQANLGYYWASISSNGRYVAFESETDNLAQSSCLYLNVFVHDLQPISPALTMQGQCPGPGTLTLVAVTAEGGVAFSICAAGCFTLTSSVCAGTILDPANPRPGSVIRASWIGTIERTYQTSPAMCGLTVQALDIHTCKTSNVLVL